MSCFASSMVSGLTRISANPTEGSEVWPSCCYACEQQNTELEDAVNMVIGLWFDRSHLLYHLYDKPILDHVGLLCLSRGRTCDLWNICIVRQLEQREAETETVCMIGAVQAKLVRVAETLVPAGPTAMATKPN